MISFALMDKEEDLFYVDWYLEEIYVLKCAVVGNMMPFIKYYDAY